MTKINELIPKEENTLNIETELRCGIIMPIAAMDNYTEAHWQDIKSIIVEATHQVTGLKFKTEIVSNSDGEINIIHKNIISNIYNSDIVVCDISGRNPNVLFELGMRLTFDKPTIIIKDDQTPYIFDTSSIETLTYPKDLRFGTIVSFKENLAKRIKITYQKSVEDTDYSPFLGHFGEFKVPVLNQTAVTEPQQIILDEISSLKDEVRSLKRESSSKLPERNIVHTINPRVAAFARTPRNEHNSELQIFFDTTINYIKETKDARDPRVIYKSKEFLDYFKNNDIDFTLTPSSLNLKLGIIHDAQKVVL